MGARSKNRTLFAGVVRKLDISAEMLSYEPHLWMQLSDKLRVRPSLVYLSRIQKRVPRTMALFWDCYEVSLKGNYTSIQKRKKSRKRKKQK